MIHNNTHNSIESAAHTDRKNQPSAEHSVHPALVRYRLEDVPIGVHLVSPWLAQTDGELLQTVHRFRHQVFIRQERYDVYSRDQCEFDEFDRPNTIHLIKQHEKQILGMIRLNPTDLPYLLEQEWAHLVNDPRALPHSPYIWEATRLAVTKSLDTRLRQRIRFELRLAMLEYALQTGVREYIALSFPVIWQTLKSIGWPTQLLGPAQRLAKGGPVVQVAKASLNADTLSLIQNISGIHQPVLLNATARVGGVSCH